jgi:hypothetical protein
MVGERCRSVGPGLVRFRFDMEIIGPNLDTSGNASMLVARLSLIVARTNLGLALFADVLPLSTV